MVNYLPWWRRRLPCICMFGGNLLFKRLDCSKCLLFTSGTEIYGCTAQSEMLDSGITNSVANGGVTKRNSYSSKVAYLAPVTKTTFPVISINSNCGFEKNILRIYGGTRRNRRLRYKLRKWSELTGQAEAWSLFLIVRKYKTGNPATIPPWIITYESNLVLISQLSWNNIGLRLRRSVSHDKAGFWQSWVSDKAELWQSWVMTKLSSDKARDITILY